MFLYLLTALLLASDPATDIATASNPKLDQLTRQSAFNRLVDTGATEIQVIIDVSQDSAADTRQRWVAIRALGKIKGPQAEQVLLRLISEKEPAIRAASLSALGDFGSPNHVSMVAARLDDDAVIVRASAAEALGKIGDPKAIVFLDRAISSRNNHYRGTSLWVRTTYVEALGEIAHKKSYPTLLRCLTDGDEKVVNAAVTALEKTAGFAFSDGRDREQEIAAWQRWLGNQLR